MKHKYIALLLCILFITVALTGCGGVGVRPSTVPNTSRATATKATVVQPNTVAKMPINDVNLQGMVSFANLTLTESYQDRYQREQALVNEFRNIILYDDREVLAAIQCTGEIVTHNGKKVYKLTMTSGGQTFEIFHNGEGIKQFVIRETGLMDVSEEAMTIEKILHADNFA